MNCLKNSVLCSKTIFEKIIAGYLGTDQGLFFDLQKMMKYAQKISDFTPLTVHDFEEIRKMSDPYYLGRLTKMNNRLLETIEANKKKKGYTVNESGEVKDEDLFYSIILNLRVRWFWSIFGRLGAVLAKWL